MRFIRLVIVVWLLLVALIGGLTLYRRTQPVSDVVQTLGLCDGQPCYLGITLGKSTWEDAKRSLTSIPGFTLSSIFQGVESLGGPIHAVFVFDDQGGAAFEVDYFFRQGAMPLSSVLVRLGVPCAVYPMPFNRDPRYPYTVILAYPKITVIVDTQNDRWWIEPTSSVVGIEFGGPFWVTGRPANDHEIDRCQGADGAVKYAWKGLRSYPYP